jgi:hypothetical protein
MVYTAEEIKKFEDKDCRISRQGLIQSLIGSGLFTREEVENVELICELAEKYRIKLSEKANGKEVEIEVNCGNMWVEAAKEVGCPVPTEQEQKVLDMVLEQTGVTLETTLKTIHGKFSKYPKNKQSVSKCVKLF